MTPSTPMPDLRIDSVDLDARDLDGLARFYQDVIGLRPIGAGGVTLDLGVGTDVLLRLLARPDALPNDPGSAGLFHTAFLLPSRADLARWLHHIHALGITIDGSADHLVSEAVYLHDPEGNGIEVYADRPPEAWAWDDTAAGRRVRMANAPLDFAGLLQLGAGQPWAGAPAGTRIGHVHLRVGDLAAGRGFYTGVLGLAETAAYTGAAFLSTSGYHHHIAINTWRSLGAGPRNPARAGLAAVVLQASTPALADAIRQRAGQGELHDPWGTALRIVSPA